MSESSKYVFVPAYIDAVPLLEGLGATGLVIENSDAWTLIVTNDIEDLEEAAVPLLLSYDFIADRGFELQVFKDGELATRVVASAGAKPIFKFQADEWIEHDVLSPKAAKDIEARLRKGSFTHVSVRDDIAKALGFRPEASLRAEDLKKNPSALYERFEGAEYVVEGKQVDWVDPSKSLDENEIEEVLQDEAAHAKEAPASAGKTPKRKAEISLKEAEEISRAFLNAAPLRREAPEPTEGSVDFAACATPRAWLDAKNRVDPARASKAVIDELERTVREGRFPGAGDSAVVVREAAAMLLARCLHAQNEDDMESMLTKALAKAKSDDERSAWDAAVARYRTLRKGKRTN